jgi:hypothetical protein
MKWFNRHLNITYGLILAVSFVVFMICLFFMLKDLKDFSPVIWIIISLCSLLPVLGAVWVLYQKQQSMWWLLIYLVFYFALIILVLVLPNKRTAQSEAKKISDNDYYKQREAGRQ